MVNLTIETLSVNPNRPLQTYLSSVDRLEGGFSNPADKSDLLNEHAFIAWLQRMDNHAHGIDLPAGFVNQTLYFFKNDDRYVGIGKLRHRLTPALYIDGGHIAYGGVPMSYAGTASARRCYTCY
uniref:GNAT family N-acetyltransferase n=1 Tax=Weissella soli TaxID=155866 RepID=UPI0035A1B4B5